MISIGHPIPDAYIPDGRIEPVSLAHYRGKWLVLFFWPLDFTFVCPTEIRVYSDLLHDFAVSSVVLLGVSVDSAHAHRAWVKHGLGAVKLPMLGDMSRALAQGFGVLAASGVAMRATFIVNLEGRVMSVAANNLNVGRSARETLRLLHALQSGELTACEWQLGEAFVAAA
ncbi:MAG TPA: peroxiredoxin [Thiobacillus sp.]|nr:MAG: thioredoxin peroxidase [Hydrogenophilales bacterium 12-63-5]OYX25742.1 MAG: thioredoxin peroxidase [Hydrogenophilales bacterium 32-62-9]OYZ55113.1 MAG: thioredoxin peroxidase [Hydrogenophilales bacterium 16-61-112]OZA41437.1 MAG: thioredoxin peroxidase [Hydrogenophilales bacterium 17-61-76]HBU28536.1 thioredoxin peroxidase [Thiobacillus sp.]